MTVMCIFRGVQVSPADYERVREAVGWEADPPAGAIFHSIGFGADGATEVNVWESAAEFQRYRDTRLAPVLEQFGVSVADPEIIEVYSMAVGDLVDPYRVPRAITRPMQPA